ncbi:MAG: hypothetical protein ACI4BA_08105 [Prevotella sp.]
MMEKYSKIINLSHHVSKSRPQMTMYQRAAQFAPFAALTGHSAAIQETARPTDRKLELSDSECDLINMKIALLMEHIQKHPEVSITFFVPDRCKEGGCYITHTGTVKRWDDNEQAITFEDGTRIRTSEIIDVRSDNYT